MMKKVFVFVLLSFAVSICNAAQTVELYEDTGGYQGVTDATLNYGSPDFNYGWENLSEVGLNGNRMVVHFALGNEIPNYAEIKSATLRMYTLADDGDPLTVQCLGLTRAWDEGSVTYNSASTGVAWDLAGGDYDSVNLYCGATVVDGIDVYHTWDVTDVVQKWVSFEVENYGLLLAGDLFGYHGKYFVTSQCGYGVQGPTLIIEYENPPLVELKYYATAGYDGVEDSLISMEYTTANYGDETTAALGVWSDTFVVGFDLNDFPSDGLVSSAFLRVYCVNAQEPGQDLAVNCAALGNDWVENEVTWNQYSTGNLWTAPGGDIDPNNAVGVDANMRMDDFTTWNVTQIVRNWIDDDTCTNNGFRLKPHLHGYYPRVIYTSEAYVEETGPRLIINYTTACAAAIAQGYGLASDVNDDCYVNLTDFAVLAGEWLECMEPTDSNCQTPWE